MIIDPPEIQFGQRARLLLTNAGEAPLSFKVKSNRNSLTAKPNVGRLVSRESAQVQFSMAGEFQENLRYMVSWIEGEQVQSSNDLWKTANSKLIKVNNQRIQSSPSCTPSIEADSASLRDLDDLRNKKMIRRTQSSSSNSSNLRTVVKELRLEREELKACVQRLCGAVQSLQGRREKEGEAGSVIMIVVCVVVGVILSRMSIL